MLLLYPCKTLMFQFSILKYRCNHPKESDFAGVFLDACLDHTQLFICFAPPENSKLIEYLNTHEAV